MHPYISLFGKSIPAYGLFAGAGILIIGIIILLYEKKSPIGRHLEMILLVELGVGLVGAKLLYIFTAIDQIKGFYNQGLPIKDIIYTVAVSGFVFYGGLYGAFLGAFIYAKLNKLDYFVVIHETMFLMPIFHAVGRVGCFMVGCCYGCETSLPIGVAFSHSEFAPNGITLVPVQLIEAVANIIILIILLWTRRKYATKDMRYAGRIVLTLYLLLYGIARFVLEFFRGDEIRGFLGPLSTSQIISIVTVLWGLALAWSTTKKNDKCVDRI